MTDLPELLEEIDEPFGPVPTAVGAGRTLAGIATGRSDEEFLSSLGEARRHAVRK